MARPAGPSVDSLHPVQKIWSVSQFRSTCDGRDTSGSQRPLALRSHAMTTTTMMEMMRHWVRQAPLFSSALVGSLYKGREREPRPARANCMEMMHVLLLRDPPVLDWRTHLCLCLALWKDSQRGKVYHLQLNNVVLRAPLCTSALHCMVVTLLREGGATPHWFKLPLLETASARTSGTRQSWIALGTPVCPTCMMGAPSGREVPRPSGMDAPPCQSVPTWIRRTYFWGRSSTGCGRRLPWTTSRTGT